MIVTIRLGNLRKPVRDQRLDNVADGRGPTTNILRRVPVNINDEISVIVHPKLSICIEIRNVIVGFIAGG
jgi:hypothetical protein